MKNKELLIAVGICTMPFFILASIVLLPIFVLLSPLCLVVIGIVYLSDEFVSVLAGLGIPAIIFGIAMSVCASAGLFGAAAISVSLCAIGPGGMLGGIVSLLIIGILSAIITRVFVKSLRLLAKNEIKSKLA